MAATGDAVALLEERGDEWAVSLTLTERGVHAVAADPLRPGTLYAGCRGSGLWQSADRGVTWEDAGLSEPDVFSVAVSPVDGALYAGCEPSRLFVRRQGDAWRELDGLQRLPSKPSWSFPPRPWTSHVRWIAPSPHDAALLLVGIELGGLMRSEDGGATWEDHRPGAQADVHMIAWHPTTPGRAYEAGGGGAAWSADGGLTWRPADAGRDRHYTWAVAPDPVDPETWYLSASTGPFAAHGSGHAQAGLYRWRGEGPWEQLGESLEAMPYALLFADGRLLAGLRDGRLLASVDRGDSWQQLRLAGASLPSIVALASLG